MSSRTDFGLIRLVTPPHLLPSCQIPCKGKNGFLAVTHVLTGHNSSPTSPAVQGINQGFTSIYLLCDWISRHLIISETIFLPWNLIKIGHRPSRATAEQPTDGQTDAMNKRNQIQEFLLLRSITTLASDTIFCLKKTSLAFSPVVPSATSACNYPTEMQIL